MLSTLRLAWRNVGRNPRRTGIVITAVAVGIAGTLTSMAIFYGMMFQMVDNAIRTDLGHLQIHPLGHDEDPAIGLLLPAGGQTEIRAITQDPVTAGYAPRIRGEGLVTSPSASVGIRVIGIDPALERDVSDVADSPWWPATISPDHEQRSWAAVSCGAWASRSATKSCSRFKI